MVTTQHLVMFCIASCILILTPGPNFVYILTRGTTQGRHAALVSSVGLGCGVVIHTLFAAVGLSALLRSSALVFSLVKHIGAIYLMYLGVKALINSNHLLLPQQRERSTSAELIRQSITASLTNPKTALFFLAFLPQFVDPTSGYIAVQMLFLGCIYMLFTVGIYGTLAYVSGSIGNWLQRRPELARRFRWLTGSVFIGLGIWAAVPDRR